VYVRVSMRVSDQFFNLKRCVHMCIYSTGFVCSCVRPSVPTCIHSSIGVLDTHMFHTWIYKLIYVTYIFYENLLFLLKFTNSSIRNGGLKRCTILGFSITSHEAKSSSSEAVWFSTSAEEMSEHWTLTTRMITIFIISTLCHKLCRCNNQFQPQ
jgi:hypothetical protein